MPRALVIRSAGTNCDAELMRAFSLAGATPELVHLDRLIADPRRVEAFDMPTVRTIVRQAEASDHRMSSYIMGVVKSPAFRMQRADSLPEKKNVTS